MNNIDVINTLSNVYFCAYQVDLLTHKYREIFAEDYMRSIVPASGDGLTDMFDTVYQRTFEPYRRELSELKNTEFIRKKLALANVFKVECKTMFIGWIEISVMAVNRDAAGQVTEILIAGENIDERKQDEIETEAEIKAAYGEVKRANRSKSDFVSRMSHDIRTPLNVIIGMTTIAAEHKGDPEKIDYCIEKIAESSKSLLALINEIFDISGLESGNIELVKEDFSIAGLMDNVLNVTKSMSELKHQKVTLDMSGLKNQFVSGDKTKLEEIITNLVTNAIKYTADDGEINISVSEENADEAGADFIFGIKDNGIGMTAEIRKCVFENKGKRAEKEKSGGIGLVITKKYVEAMNGTIDVISEPLHGSEFVVRVRMALQDNAVNRMIEGRGITKLSDINLNGKRALLVEDNELNAEIAKELIGMTGITVERAHDGAEAVDMFTTSPFNYYDIIFMDIVMPVMDGYAATTAIRASERPDSSIVPIIAMTANAFASDIRAALIAGMNDHIAKPIDNEYLAKVLIKFFGGII